MSGYEYGNTRLRAMRARLLDRSDYSDLIGAGTLDRMLAMLSDTPYASHVESALVRARGLERLDRTLRSNLAATLRKMASFYEGRPGQLVGLLLSRWDLRNLLALIRLSDVAATGADNSGLLVPAGRLGENELAELAAQDGVAPLIDLMVAWAIPSADSAFDLLRARATYDTEGDIYRLELAVDQAFAAETDRVASPEGGEAIAILRAEVDARNLELALRLRAARIDQEPGWSDAADAYLFGGIQPIEVWKQIADSDAPEAVAELAGARSPIPGWREAVSSWVPEGTIADLSDDLQRAITAAARSRFVSGDQLGFDIPLAYTFAKEAEVRNLRLIGRGIVHHIPISEIDESLEVAA